MSRTLFIHIPRTAGTSIQSSGIAASTRNIGLKADIQKQMSMDPRGPHTIGNSPSNRLQKHIPYNYLSREYLNRFDRLFSVVRNPWARVVSFYNYGNMMAEVNTFKDTWYHQNALSFDHFLNKMDEFIMTPSYYWNHPYNQWAMQMDWINLNKVDVLRYENLSSDLNLYFNKSINLPFVNQSPSVDYKSYFNEKQKQKIADWFKVDIEHWGFDFETGATKNYWVS